MGNRLEESGIIGTHSVRGQTEKCPNVNDAGGLRNLAGVRRSFPCAEIGIPVEMAASHWPCRPVKVTRKKHMNQTRREFLKNTAFASVTVVGSAWMVACSNEQPAPAEPAPAAPPPPAPPAAEPVAAAPPADAAAPAAGGEGPNCTDVSALSEPDKTMRTTLAYVDRSTTAGKDCKGCQLFIAAADAAGCGTCSVVKGPISPLGYCNSWVQKV